MRPLSTYAKSAELSLPLSSPVARLNPWHMPLLFVLAGMSTWFALRRRTGGQYLRERVLRRLAAARQAGLADVPVVVRSLTLAEQLELQLGREPAAGGPESAPRGARVSSPPGDRRHPGEHRACGRGCAAAKRRPECVMSTSLVFRCSASVLPVP
jgi:hypothetical protein